MTDTGGNGADENFGELITNPVFQAVLDNANQGPLKDTSKIKDFRSRTKWRIVGVRFDTCFKVVVNDPNCLVQIRLVAQPFEGINDEDVAMHLVYHPNLVGKIKGDDKIREDIVKQLKELKAIAKKAGVITNGLPLGVHPAFPEIAHGENLNTDFANGVKKFILRNTGVNRLVGMAFMGISEFRGVPWAFSANRVVNGKAIPGDVGHTQKPSKFIVFPVLDNQTKFNIDPPPTHPDNLESSLRFTSETDMTSRQKWFDRATRIENPNKHTPLSVDCVSCHQSSRIINAVNNVGQKTFGEKIIPAKNLNLQSADLYKTPLGITPGVHPDSGDGNSNYALRNFGLFGGQASINNRTSNESAEVANFVNRKVSNLTDADIRALQVQATAILRCTEPPIAKFSQVGRADFGMFFNDTFRKGNGAFTGLARARLISPLQPKDPSFTHKFSVFNFDKDSNERDSNIGFKLSDNGNTMTGQQYNFKDFDGLPVVRKFTMKWNCNHYTGEIAVVGNPDNKLRVTMSVAR